MTLVKCVKKMGLSSFYGKYKFFFIKDKKTKTETVLVLKS